jgi:PAS domain S-box-containing protein
MNLLAEPGYRALIEVAPDAILVYYQGSMKYAFANAAAEWLLGYSRDELLRMGPSDLLDPTELPPDPKCYDSWKPPATAGPSGACAAKMATPC